jgi:nitrogen fixation NifU-like protein
MTKFNTNIVDVQDEKGDSWAYTEIVKDHFFDPRNIMLTEPKDLSRYNGIGVVGAPVCGDVMKLWLKIDPETERIKTCKWKTFGCASAIASSSILSVMVTKKSGLPIAEARKITPQDIIVNMGGLPTRKIHCSVLADQALRKAINNYYFTSGQIDKIKLEAERTIDKEHQITDFKIEQMVIKGYRTVKDVMGGLNVPVDKLSPATIAEVEANIDFYSSLY